MSNLNQGCIPRSIVHRAVVNAVAFHRRTDPKVVEVCTDHHVFLLELRITARKKAYDVLRFCLRTN